MNDVNDGLVAIMDLLKCIERLHHKKQRKKHEQHTKYVGKNH